MKLSGREARRFFADPDKDRAAILIYGPEPTRIAMRRRQVQQALLGPEGEAEMRLTRIAAADLRRESALLQDAMLAQGFFGGQRVVVIDDAGDGTAADLDAALSAWQPGDAFLLITAGSLPARSKLRALFEKSAIAVAAPIYDDPPDRGEVEDIFRKFGLADVEASAIDDAVTLAQQTDPGELAQTIEKLALYKIGDDQPVGSEDLAACAPTVTDAGVDETINCVAEGKVAAVGSKLHRLAGQGATPVTLCIAASRHFRALHMAACHPSGLDTALSRLRPPVFGARRNRMRDQLRRWNLDRLERALQVLGDTDLALRSSRPVPAGALLERAFLRITMMGQQK